RECATNSSGRIWHLRAKHLVVSLSRFGWGEASMAFALAKQLVELGDAAFFVVSENLAPLMSAAGVPGETVNESLGPLAELLVKDVISTERPTDMVLGDHLVCADSFQRMGLDISVLKRFDLPI